MFGADRSRTFEDSRSGSAAARDAMAAEDLLIKYARDEAGGSANWNPALHPRTGAPPNPGWFAPTDGSRDSSGVHVAENQLDSHRTDAEPISNDGQLKPPPGHHIDELVSFDDAPSSKDQKDQSAASEFWSTVRSAISNWLQELVPEYDPESGRVVGERPRWRAIAPYVGIPAATAAIFGGEAIGLPAVLSALGLGGDAAGAAAGGTEGVSEAASLISSIAQEQANLGVSGLARYM